MTHVNSNVILTYNGSPNLGQKTRPYNNQQKKGACKIVDFVVVADPRLKLKVSEKKDKYLDLARDLKKKKTVENYDDNYTNHDWCFWYSHQRIIKGTGGFRNLWMNGYYPNYSIIDNGQNSGKSPGELRRLAVTQTPV